jgi:hypothetical protein
MLGVISFVISTSPLKLFIKYICVFLMFTMLFTSWFYSQSLSGYAFEHPLPNKFQLIWGQEIQHVSIEMWVNKSEGNSYSNISRLYTVPWNQDLSKKLNDAKKSLAQGIPVFMSKNASDKTGKKGHGIFEILRGSIASMANMFNSNSQEGEDLEITNQSTDTPQKN